MAELRFTVEDSGVPRFTASPQITLVVRAAAEAAGRNQSLALRAQVMIDVGRRRHTLDEQARTIELFGPSPWMRAPASLLWANLVVTTPPFDGETRLELALPFGYDFAAAAHRYLTVVAGAGADADVPLTVLFSGTVFHEGPSGLRVSYVDRACQAEHLLPARVLREALDAHYAGAAMISLSRDVHARLDRWRIREGLTTWDEAMARLLDEDVS